MAQVIKCDCGYCITCRRRRWQRNYRTGVFEGKKVHTVYNKAENTNLTTVAEDAKELESKFPWLRINLETR